VQQGRPYGKDAFPYGRFLSTGIVRIFAEVQNLTNEPVRMYLGDPSRTKDLEWSAVRGQIGLRWSIF
jgi:hypothetical protein